MFSVHTTLKEFKNATITGQFGFLVELNSARENNMISKSSVFKMFPSTVTLINPAFEECFCDGLAWMVGLTVEIKLCSNLSGVVLGLNANVACFFFCFSLQSYLLWFNVFPAKITMQDDFSYSILHVG